MGRAGGPPKPRARQAPGLGCRGGSRWAHPARAKSHHNKQEQRGPTEKLAGGARGRGAGRTRRAERRRGPAAPLGARRPSRCPPRRARGAPVGSAAVPGPARLASLPSGRRRGSARAARVLSPHCRGVPGAPPLCHLFTKLPRPAGRRDAGVEGVGGRRVCVCVLGGAAVRRSHRSARRG